MKILLDTHVFIWMASTPEKLSDKAKKAILDHNNQLYLSSVTLWEMQIKLNLGKLKLKIPLKEMCDTMISNNAIELLSIGNSHIWQLDNIEKHHKDPFDRMLIAQAQVENMKILTKDKIIPMYSVEIIW